jgi:hypothetical protein
MSQKRMSKNGWNTFFNVILTILIVLVLLYIAIAIYLAVKYNQATKSVEEFNLRSLKVLANDLNITYDFQNDPHDINDINAKMSRDLVDSLLSFYDGNLHTVSNTIKNLAGCSGMSQSGEFQTDAESFVAVVLQNIPFRVLFKSAYFSRFFETLYLTVDNDVRASIIKTIRRKIDEILHPTKM